MAKANRKVIRTQHKEQPKPASLQSKWRELHRRLDFSIANALSKNILIDIEESINESYDRTIERLFEKNQILRRKVKPGEVNQFPFQFDPGVMLSLGDFDQIDGSLSFAFHHTKGDLIFVPTNGGQIETHIVFEIRPPEQMANYEQISGTTLVLTYREPWDDTVFSTVVEQRIPMEKDKGRWHFVCLMGEQRHFSEFLYAGYSYFVCGNCFRDADQLAKIDEHRKKQTMAFLNVTIQDESDEDEQH